LSRTAVRKPHEDQLHGRRRGLGLAAAAEGPLLAPLLRQVGAIVDEGGICEPM